MTFYEGMNRGTERLADSPHADLALSICQVFCNVQIASASQQRKVRAPVTGMYVPIGTC